MLEINQKPLLGKSVPADGTAPNWLPEHIAWSFGGKFWESPVAAQSLDFQYWLSSNLRGQSPGTFREEMIRACQRIDQRRNGVTVALCYSGGIDSEAIALTLHELGIPFELYFLDLWGINCATFDRWAPALSAKIGKSVRVVSLSRERFWEDHAVRAFREFGIEFPTYLALTYLFDQIPSDQFLVVGDGDLNRSGNLYRTIARENPVSHLSGQRFAFSTASVFYYLWAQKGRRNGEFYFYSSTPGIVASMLSDPLFRQNFPESDTREVIYAAFPEIHRREKSTNWDGEHYRENINLRNWLRNQSMIFRNFDFWKPSAGTVASLGDSALPRAAVEAREGAELWREVPACQDSFTICAHPWTHLAYKRGQMSPCCEYNGQHYCAEDSVQPDLLGSPYFSTLRAQMLRGEKPTGCGDCYKRETLGGFSARTLANSRFPRAWMQAPRIRSLEFNLGNLCNLKCRDCNSSNSTKWAQEERQLGLDEAKISKPIRVSLKPLKSLLPHLEVLKLLGGEPFLIPEHEELIRLIDQQKAAPKLRLDYSTNGTARVSGAVLEVWRQLRELQITFSIDGLRENNDFFRSGSHWKDIFANMRWFERSLQGARVAFVAHTVVNIYNIHEIVELDNWLAAEFPAFALSKDVLVAPTWLNIRNLPETEKTKLRAYFKELAQRHGNAPARKDAYLRISHWLEAPALEGFQKFAQMHQRLNQLRGESYVPPQLQQLLSSAQGK